MKQKETNTSVLIFDEEIGILIVKAKPDVDLKLEDAERDFKTGQELVNYKKTPVLSDSRELSYSCKEVRDFYAQPIIANHISAMAILIDSLPGRLLGNFFMKFNNPPYPVKVFNDETAAIEWLKKFLL
jgi:hypothetical protein